MEIFRENENQIINIRIWNEKENEDGLSAESYIEELDNLVTNLLNR